MTQRQIDIGEALIDPVEEVKARHEFPTLAAATRYLIALGLAAEWDRRHVPFSSSNPFLEVSWNLRAKR